LHSELANPGEQVRLGQRARKCEEHVAGAGEDATSEDFLSAYSLFAQAIIAEGKSQAEGAIGRAKSQTDASPFTNRLGVLELPDGEHGTASNGNRSIGLGCCRSRQGADRSQDEQRRFHCSEFIAGEDGVEGQGSTTDNCTEVVCENLANGIKYP